MNFLIAILRRDEADLTPAEKAAIAECFPGNATITYQRIDPKDCFEHDQICLALNPAAVILPKDRPIPAIAMERGVVHLAVVPKEGTAPQAVRLVKLDPVFKEWRQN